MIITCPNCGSEFEVNAQFFRQFMNEHHGFRDIVMEWIKSDSEMFEFFKAFVHAEIDAKNRAERAEKKARKEEARKIMDAMDPDLTIEFLNTPYKQQPQWLKDHDFPEILMEGMTKWPQVFNFVRFNQPRIGEQVETCGARCVRFRKEYNMSREDMAKLCNLYTTKFDLKANDKRRAQQTRSTANDFEHYENHNVSPKIDKMTAISKATGMPIAYIAGYGPGEGVLSGNEILRAKFRKAHAKNPDEKSA